MSLLSVVSLLFLLTNLEANSQTADLDLAMSFDVDLENLIPGQQYPYTLTVTNNGPDVVNQVENNFFFAGSTLIGSNDLWIPDVLFDFDVLNSSAGCRFDVFFVDPLPNQNPNYAFTYFFFQIDVGESITCRGTYTVNFTEGSRSLTWQLINSLASDPDLGNNEVELNFGLRPVSVPINSIWPLFSLILGMFFLAKKYSYEFQ